MACVGVRIIMVAVGLEGLLDYRNLKEAQKWLH